MYIRELLWDDYRIEQIARHDVEPNEVEEVCHDPFHLARREGRNRYRMYGQTMNGRYLFVVLESVTGTSYKPITARDMHRVRNKISESSENEPLESSGLQIL